MRACIKVGRTLEGRRALRKHKVNRIMVDGPQNIWCGDLGMNEHTAAGNISDGCIGELSERIKIVTKEENGEVCVWCTAGCMKEMFDFLQYMLDSLHNPERFLVLDPEAKKACNAFQLATKGYGMRRRTFMERMENVSTVDLGKLEKGGAEML